MKKYFKVLSNWSASNELNCAEETWQLLLGTGHYLTGGEGGGRATKLKKKIGSEIVALPLLPVSKIVALPKFEFKK